MDDSVAMRFVERVGDFQPKAQDLRERQRAFSHFVGKSLAFQVLHDQEIDAVLAADIVERANVRMGEPGDDSSLALESNASVFRESRRQNFDRYITIEACVAGAIDLSH